MFRIIFNKPPHNPNHVEGKGQKKAKKIKNTMQIPPETIR